ncbi:hypothetical protein [Rhizobium sp. BK491]|uniref:hypothetical protein n=1 Tax=Rhizobium sp. BK491 TaxID=2587009 RepID=UPI00160BBE34|nr:hypothetical protein [Rhizobium sp. BK491]MBB3571588.1 hypothetical protein [Rhizobium sp. BK491]
MAQDDNKTGAVPADLAKKMQDMLKDMEGREDVDPVFKDLTGKKVEFKLKGNEVAWYVAYSTTA